MTLTKQAPSVSLTKQGGATGVLRVNLTGAFLGIRTLAPLMAAGASIVQVSAAYGDSRRRILVANSDGLLAEDDQVKTLFDAARFDVRERAVGDQKEERAMRDGDPVALHHHLADARPLQIVLDLVGREAKAPVVLAHANDRLKVGATFHLPKGEPPQRPERPALRVPAPPQ